MRIENTPVLDPTNCPRCEPDYREHHTYTAVSRSKGQHAVSREEERKHCLPEAAEPILIVAIAGLLACNAVNQVLLIWAHDWCQAHGTLHGVIAMASLLAGMRATMRLQERGERR